MYKLLPALHVTAALHYPNIHVCISNSNWDSLDHRALHLFESIWSIYSIRSSLMPKLRLHHASSTFGAIAGSSHHFVWRLLANPHTRVTLRCPWTHLFGPHPARRGLVFQLPLIKEWMHRNVFERLMLDYTKKTLDGKTFGSASQEFIDIHLNYIKHLDWWLVTYFLRRKNSSVPAWIENNQNLNARCPVESCHAWFHVFHLSVRSLSKSIQSLSLSISPPWW